MIKALASLLAVAIILLIAAVDKLKKYSNERELYELVSWCATIDSSVHRNNLRLSDYIHNAQIKESLSPEYRITGKDWDVVGEIIEHFQKELTQNYLKGNLKVIKAKHAIPGEHYFMFALNSFLADHQCDYDFHGHSMHLSTVEYKRYGDWGGPLYDATYAITEFAFVYHKLYYISYLFCRDSQVFNPNGESFGYSDNIKKVLDSKQLKVSRY